MLTIRDLEKTYPDGTHALAGVNLEIPTGMFGLLGPNGAGKSSLMRTIATLQEPDAGSIHFDGIDVLADPQALRGVLGYLPQEFGVYPRMSAEALLDHLATLKGIEKSERGDLCAELLRLTNLWDHRKKAVSGYSGGMRQRFGVAQALIGDPRLLIVDEPTAGLDPEERRRFLDLLSEIGESVVVILSTHIVDDVRELCENMAVLNAGRVVLRARPEEAIRELAGTIWRAVVTKDEARGLRESMTVISSRLRGGRVQLRVQSGERPKGFDLVEPDLEDLYFTTLA